jgi:uncharacterized lipoprotein YajG
VIEFTVALHILDGIVAIIRAMRGLLLVCAWACGGCALTTWQAQVPPVSVQAQARLSGDVVVRSVADHRDNRRIGIKKNGWGHITADVLSTTGVDDVVLQSLANSLRASGMNVVAQSGRPWTIDGEILQFVAEPDVGAWTIDIYAETHVRVQVAAPDGGVYLRTFVGHGEKTGIFVPSEDDYVQALYGALGDVIGQIVAAVGELAAQKAGGA